MVLSGRTVLVTGGATGIGLAIATRFRTAGSTVVVCGRRVQPLSAAGTRGLITRQADVSSAAARIELIRWMFERYPRFDTLVNNAGIQRRVAYVDDVAPWDERSREIAINFEAPIHLASLVQSRFANRGGAAIWNVSSGLAFLPAPFAPIYAATKAALHSATMSMRAAYASLGIEVIEIIPPSVNTNLGGALLQRHGVPVDTFADAVMDRIADGEVEIGYGTSDVRRRASRAELDAEFDQMIKDSRNA